MIKTKLFILVLTLFLLAPKTFFGQAGGPVTLDGKQFKINGANFYPMVMNYGVELTRQQNEPWNNSYLTPYIEYGVNLGPFGGPNSYFFECNNLNQCNNDIIADWTYLLSKGFNTIRVAGFYTKYQESPKTLYFKCRESYQDIEYYFNLNPFVPGDPECVFVLDQYENLMQIADAVGVKLIFNLIGTNSHFTQIPGSNNDEIEYYNAFFELLASRISNSPYANSVMAVDIWNEPCYEDLANDKSKQQACEIISTWYNTFKNNGPFPLVTLGTCGSGDIIFYDPGVLKVDFFSLHIYPEWRAFEDKTDPAIQQRAISRVYDELYWFNKISPYPWIIGETSLAASANLQVQPQGGAHGTLADQANYAQLIMDATCSCGGSGFSWWAFQDGWWLENTSIPHPAHWGILERGFSTGVPAEKPVAALFNGIPPVVGSCGPCPVSSSSLQTYNSSLTYFNPFQHPPNPSNTIKGYVYDQDGNPIANAYVGGHTNLGKNNSNIQEFEFQRVFTAENGYFELIPFDYYTNSTVTVLEGKLITLGITSAGGERYKYSEHYWTICNCSLTMPSANINHTWNLDRVNFAYEGDYNNINILNGENRILEAYSNLTVSNCTLNSGATTEIMARNAIRIKSESHAFAGSSVHIHCETTEVDCNDYAGYSMQYKLNSSNMPLSKNDERFINLEFNNDSISSEFAIFPNPASTHFTIVRNQNYPVEMKVYSIIGEFIESFILTSEKSFMNAKSYNRGLYLIKNNSTGQVQKLILQ